MFLYEFVCILVKSKKNEKKKILRSGLCPLSPQMHCIAKAQINFPSDLIIIYKTEIRQVEGF